MSKGLGSKIAIKFTDDLVGDVAGNENAFKVTGKEYKYVNGPLIEKDYIVDKVERYPVSKTWQDSFNNGVMVNVELSNDGLTLEVE